MVLPSSDTLPARSGEVLLSSSPLARLPPRRRTSSGGLSRSVFRILGGFPVPQGTGKSHQKEYAESSVQNVHGGIFVSVQDESTDRANMGAHLQALLDPCTTGGTIFPGE